MAQKEVKQWITMNGKHIPIFEGESKEDAINRAIAKSNEDKKNSDIQNRKKETDKFTAEKNGSIKEDAVKKVVQNMSKKLDKKPSVDKKDVDELTKKKDALKDTKLNAKPVTQKEIDNQKAQWKSWKEGDEVVYTAEKEFDMVKAPKPEKGKVLKVEDDHAVVEVDGMKMWVDKDNISRYRPVKSTSDSGKNTGASDDESETFLAEYWTKDNNGKTTKHFAKVTSKKDDMHGVNDYIKQNNKGLSYIQVGRADDLEDFEKSANGWGGAKEIDIRPKKSSNLIDSQLKSIEKYSPSEAKEYFEKIVKPAYDRGEISKADYTKLFDAVSNKAKAEGISNGSVKATLTGNDAIKHISSMEKGIPLMIKMGKDLPYEQVIYAGRGETQGRDTLRFFDGSGIGGTFGFTSKFISEHPEIQFKFNDNDPSKVTDLLKAIKGGSATSDNKPKDYFISGNTKFSLTKSGKDVYLVMSGADGKGATFKFKVAYANNPEKARANLGGTGKLAYLNFKDQPELLELLKNLK